MLRAVEAIINVCIVLIVVLGSVALGAFIVNF